MTEQAICAFWGSDCKAIAMEGIPDLKKVKREWIRDGADEIRRMPVEEAKAAMMAWIGKRNHPGDGK